MNTITQFITEFLPLILDGTFGLLFFIPPVLFTRAAIKDEGVNFGTVASSFIAFFVFGAIGVLFISIGFGLTFYRLTH